MPSALFETLLLQGSKQAIPAFLYGTAWKKEKTADLVYQALCSGFRGVDTAAQPKHYREDLVGDGIRRALSEGRVVRENLFIQTKFTSVQGQDPHALPYDPESTIAEQVHTSIRSSLRNLRPLSDESSSGSTFLDCLVFHSPLPTIADTLVAWRTAESYVPHKIRHLGISNVHLPTLEQLFSTAKIKPAVVQNRFHPGTQFDTQVRAFCVGESIVYQSFWTLSANPEILKSSEVSALADQAGLTAYEAMYCFVLACNNVVILNGTTNEKHMLGDLAAVQKTRDFASLYPVLWKKQLNKFKILIKDPDTVRQTERP